VQLKQVRARAAVLQKVLVFSKPNKVGLRIWHGRDLAAGRAAEGDFELLQVNIQRRQKRSRGGLDTYLW